MNRTTNKQITTLTMIIVVFLSSCSVDLAKRYKSQSSTWVSKEATKRYVEVQAETFNIIEPAKTPTSLKDIFTLSPEGQAELIKALGGKTANVDELFNSLSKKLSSENNSNNKVKVFPTTISKSIVFSVDRLWAARFKNKNNNEVVLVDRIGDRVSNLEVSVNIPNTNNMKFNSWDKFVTDYVTVDLGKVASSQQWSATGTISYNAGAELANSEKSTTGNSTGTKTGKADIGQSELTDGTTGGSEKNKGGKISAGIGGSASVNYTDKYETNLNLHLQRMKLSGTLSQQKMTLRQEGAFGIDLSGNTAVSVDISFNGNFAAPISVFKINSYYDKTTGAAMPATSISKNSTMWIFPDISADVIATLQYKYLYRYVRPSSKKYIPEARQRVKHYYGEVGYRTDAQAGDPDVAVNVTLIKPADFKPITYKVGTTNGGGATTFIQWDSEDVNFETASEAAAFLEYLTTLCRTTQTYGTISGIPANNTLTGFRVIKNQN